MNPSTLTASTIWQISEPNRSDDPLTHRYQYQEQEGAPIPERIATRESFPWTMEKILRGEVVTISKMADLPPEAARDRESYRFYGTKSTVVIPLMAGGVVLGQMAFATLARGTGLAGDPGLKDSR